MVGYITVAHGAAQRLSEKWRHFVCTLLSSLFCTSPRCVGVRRSPLDSKIHNSDLTKLHECVATLARVRAGGDHAAVSPSVGIDAAVGIGGRTALRRRRVCPSRARARACAPTAPRARTPRPRGCSSRDSARARRRRALAQRHHPAEKHAAVGIGRGNPKPTFLSDQYRKWSTVVLGGESVTFALLRPLSARQR